MRIAFFGSRPVARECLRLLRAEPAVEIVGASCGETPWWAWWTGAGLSEAVREWGVPLLEQDDDVIGLRVDLIISVYYDRLLSEAAIDSARLGVINLHGAPLPEYRGRLSSLHPILNGEREHGVTLHYIDASVDTGPIIESRRFPIPPTATARELYDLTEQHAIALFRDRLPDLLAGPPAGTPQGPGRYLYTGLDVPDGEVDLRWPPEYIDRYVRALTFPPLPGPWMRIGGRKAEITLSDAAADGPPFPRGLATDRPYHRSAWVYDALYANKDYRAECDYLERQFERFARRPIRRILDVGCGTGLHASFLTSRGYSIFGVDLSSTMIGIARERARRNGQRIAFRQRDMERLALGRTFDAAILMFAAFGAVTQPERAASVLTHIRDHLRPGGLLLLDVWQWLPSYFATRTDRLVTQSGQRVRREGHVTIDDARQVASLQYRFTIDGAEEWREVFDVRAYTPEELRSLCAAAGLAVEEICAAYTPGSSPAGAPSIALVARRPDA